MAVSILTATGYVIAAVTHRDKKGGMGFHLRQGLKPVSVGCGGTTDTRIGSVVPFL